MYRVVLKSKPCTELAVNGSERLDFFCSDLSVKEALECLKEGTFCSFCC